MVPTAPGTFGEFLVEVGHAAHALVALYALTNLDVLLARAQLPADRWADLDARGKASDARLADKTCTRLRARNLVAGCVTVKIRRKDFTTYTRQRHFEPPTQETRVIAHIASELLDAWLRTQPRRPSRRASR